MTPRISFAQQGEDVVLWRALGNRPPGRFVDVGAHHPTGSSVTRIFYDAGWRGINIEPLATLMPLFEEERPEDVNLAVGISDHVGELTFYDVVADQQRSTFSPDLAGAYRRQGLEVVERGIPVVTLDSVFEQYVDGPVDFLKIDAENHEDEVFRSIDLDRWRPHVILAEAPLIAATPWVDRVLSARYRLALFDGLNRFYVAEEHWEELGEALSYPACSTDGYETFDHLLALNALRDERDGLAREVDALRAELSAARVRAEAAASRRRWPRRRS